MLHLNAANLVYLGLRSASPLLLSGQTPWHPSLQKRGAALVQNLARLSAENGADKTSLALDSFIAGKAKNFLDGLNIYQAHPYQRKKSGGKAVWRKGGSTLLDFGGKNAKANPVFLIPSLINKSYIFDLRRGQSFVDYLREQGFRPLLLDWGAPGKAETDFGLEDYTHRAGQALLAAIRLYGKKPTLLGYCMGGFFAAALAQLHQNKCAGAVFMATPWDFHLAYPHPRKIEFLRRCLLPVFEKSGIIPVPVLQGLFYDLDPLLGVKKFERLARAEKRQIESFVVLEDWLNDGIPLGYRVFRQCLESWYRDNKLPRKKQALDAKTSLDPVKIHIPTLCVIPSQDRIVPPQSALSLARQLPHTALLQPDLGHIGMLASRGAKTALWPEIAAWLHRNAKA